MKKQNKWTIAIVSALIGIEPLACKPQTQLATSQQINQLVQQLLATAKLITFHVIQRLSVLSIPLLPIPMQH